MIRDQTLKIKTSKRGQRKAAGWEKRQRQTLGRSAKVWNVSDVPRKKFLGKSKNNKERSNDKVHATTKSTKRPTRTTCMLEQEDPCVFRSEKRQQSSPAVTFARLGSNQRYEPGDYAVRKERIPYFKQHIVEKLLINTFIDQTNTYLQFAKFG